VSNVPTLDLLRRTGPALDSALAHVLKPLAPGTGAVAPVSPHHLIKKLYFFEEKGFSPLYSFLTNPFLDVQVTIISYAYRVEKRKELNNVLYSTHLVYNNKLVSVRGFNKLDTLIRACHVGVKELIAFTQGRFTFAMEKNLGAQALRTVPPQYTFTHKIPGHTCISTVTLPSPPARTKAVSESQAAFLAMLDPDMLKRVQQYSFTTDEQANLKRYHDGMTILASEHSTRPDNMTPEEFVMLNLDYIFNRAPRASPRDMPMRLKEYQPRDPTLANVLCLALKNGAVGDLGDSGECCHSDTLFSVLSNKKKSRATQLTELAQEYRTCENKPIQYSGLAIKPEVAKRLKELVKEDGDIEILDKKIRSISNANSVKYIMMALLFPGQDRDRRGFPAGTFVGESVRNDYFNIMLRTWYEKSRETWLTYGVDTFGKFLMEVDKRGFDCTDKECWEATTKDTGAGIYMYQNALHVPETSYPDWKNDIQNVSAEYTQPHVVLEVSGNVAKGINRKGSTESGGQKTLDGNSLRHQEMHLNFNINMDMWYLRGKEKFYPTQHDFIPIMGEPPELEDPLHELIIDKECANIDGDDHLNLATPLDDTGFKARWLDWKHGTITTGGVKRPWAELDKYGRVTNDSAEYLRTYMQLVKPSEDPDTWWVKTLRCAVRTFAKLMYAPHALEVALMATRQAMFIGGTPELYGWLLKYYKLLYAEAVKIGEELVLDKFKELAKTEEYCHLPSPSSLAPPSYGECEAFLAPDPNRALRVPAQVAHYKEFAQSRR